MPEGHTIYREARDQRPLLAGRVLRVTSPQGRFTDGAARLDGRRCESLEAYGKHLLYGFEGDDTLHLHFGLYGKVRKAEGPAPAPIGAVRVRFESAVGFVDMNGPNRCEILDASGVGMLLGRLGPDVLRPDADPDLAWTRITATRTAIGLLLMDQSVIAGIGNIYRTEILWRQRLAPELPGRALTRPAFDAVWRDAAHLLAIGVEQRAIVTVDGASRGAGRYGGVFNIFNKPDCPRCGGPVRKFTLAGRRAFACDLCQPMPAG